MATTVREVMSTGLVTVGPSASVMDAASAMSAARVGSVLVLDAGALAGIFTERDALEKVAGEPIDPAAIPIREMMTPRPETLREDDILAFALHRMAVGHYRHIPILRGDHPIGFVSVRGLLRYLARNTA